MLSVTWQGRRIVFEPGVFERLAARQPLAWILGEEFPDQVLALEGHLVELLVVEVEAGGFNFSRDFFRAFSLEGRKPADHNVQNDTERPNVSLSAMRAFYDLGCQVVRGAATSYYPTLASESLGQAEVDQAHHIHIVDHYVLQLDVTMNDILSVAVIDCFEEAFHIAGRPLL